MKIGSVGFGLFLAAFAVFAQDPFNPASPQPQAATRSEASLSHPAWGVATDPDGDITFRGQESGTLTIVVPGSDHPHDLAAETGVTNAPRVLQPVKGDFVAEVRVGGKFQPGGESTLPGRSGYNGAGLLFFVDAENCVTLARATLQFVGHEPKSYVNFEMRSGGELQRMGSTGDRPITSEEPLFLRLERKGNQMLAAVSEDGTNWESLEAKTLPSEWPESAKAGVVAISTSKQPFEPSFSNLKLQGQQAPAAAVPTAAEKPSLPGEAANAVMEKIRQQIPEKITPISKEHLAAKVPHFYFFEYQGMPQPGKRYWLRVDENTWVERYPDGFQSTFKVLGHAKVEGQEGTMVVKISGAPEETDTTNDGGLQAFIPDKGSEMMRHFYRNSSRGDTEWNDLAEMEAVQ